VTRKEQGQGALDKVAETAVMSALQAFAKSASG